jgi:CDP-diacylglycerol--serine O-phosphatidyltransferase
MNIRRHIPNLITCLALALGCVATLKASHGLLFEAMMLIIACALLDFADGFVARLLRAGSPVGKELDSLSDIVCFGLAPGLAVHFLLSQGCGALPFGAVNPYIPHLAFIIPVFSALRLAKFNIDDRQTETFLGLPVPAHALFWASASYTLLPVVGAVNRAWFAVFVVLSATLTSLLLVSEIPMFSLKVKSPAWKGNELRYILVVCGLLFIIFFGFPGIAGAIGLYVLLSYLCRADY